MATIAEVADHLDVSSETIRLLKKRGVLNSAARGQIDLDASRVTYIRHLREQAAGRSSVSADAEGLDIVKERARLAKENADHKAMANAQARGELVAVTDVTAALVGFIQLSKSQLMKVAARVAAGEPRLKARVQAAIEEALEELTLVRVQEATGAGGEEEEEDD